MPVSSVTGVNDVGYEGRLVYLLRGARVRRHTITPVGHYACIMVPRSTAWAGEGWLPPARSQRLSTSSGQGRAIMPVSSVTGMNDMGYGGRPVYLRRGAPVRQ